MGVLCLIYLVLALRTNLVFVGIFLTLVFAFGFLSGSFWYAAQGKAALAGRLQIAGGAFAFVTCMFGWWIFAAIMLAALDFPFQLPGKFLLQLRVVALAVLTLIFQSVTCPTSSPEPVRRRTRRPSVARTCVETLSAVDRATKLCSHVWVFLLSQVHGTGECYHSL